MIETCFFCHTEVVLSERMTGDLSQWRAAHRICYRHTERKEAAKPAPTIYQFYTAKSEMVCKQCEKHSETYVILHTPDTTVLVGRREEHLCAACFTKRQRLLDNAQWIQITKNENDKGDLKN